ncbi:similar to Saccharomyces cerevisiae YLR103C CDC45 DNA replication initiation factor [Maudiozyma saulgeensis]|uniref:Similar to Saccharomyces cerevisiae YLR103C CDC45 DNA replication initiation factor n=1 Tax=Maudiozyma saulgeensis TaxID=1789683 RepID=A0A1X7R862_9SACH|nr:similar to Saccharomyces cerevisiae YLR103C CDC45 DNA replication initiation factor [Kazachstania saulgeensis]
MYYRIDQYTNAYNKILKESSNPSTCQLVIFVSCLNIDALCATRMLATLFKKQLVQLQIVPVFGYSELKTHYSKLDENINSIILVGFGSYVDIETFLEIDPNEYRVEQIRNEATVTNEDTYKRHIYILDSHRPWNLDNLFGSDIVQCFDDGTVDDSLGEQKEAYFKLIELEAERDPDQDEHSDDESEDDTDNDDEDEEDNILDNGKRAHPDDIQDKKQARKLRRKQISKYETILEEYYSQGTTVVNSISSQVYSLMSAIGETNLVQLWLAILGATSLDTTYSAVYNNLYPIMQDEVKRLSPGNGLHISTRSNGSNSAIKTPDTLSLEIQPDYYLFLLRHSSLYDSFYYSNFVNAKLSLWSENGKKRLHKMFARMGIPLSTAHETWLYMDNSIKRELGNIFHKNLDRYGLQDIIRDGFVRTFGYRGSISASEYVESLAALLEAGSTLNATNQSNSSGTSVSTSNSNINGGSSNGIENNHNGEKNSNNNNSEYEEDTIENSRKKAMASMENIRKQWVSNFWLSWDALDEKNIDILSKGIRHAQFLQKSIFNTGVTILEKKMIKHLRIYRLCVLQDGPDLAIYQNPLTLLRLGNWLIECCAEAEDKQLLPMVLACLDEETDTYLVAGLSPRYPRGLDTLRTKEPILNNFSMAFQQITAQTGAKVKIDNFESSIIEIRKDDLSPFLEKLTLSGLL